MKFPTLLVALCLSVVTANASIGHGSDGALAARHHHVGLVSRQATSPEKKPRRRCRAREPTSSLTAESAARTSSSSSSSSSSTRKAETTTSTPAPENTQNSNNNNNNGGGGGGGGNGRTTTATGPCGWNRAEPNPSRYNGPNGHIDWLNCGIEEGGWNPPNLNMGNVVYKNLWEALAMPNSPFEACRRFIPLFERYAGETGLPPILLASIAMQESSCNPNTVGGGGEQGLMQITRDKCGGAPGGNCLDPDFNIRTGAHYFAGRLRNAGGNLVVAAGGYNGWRQGLTVADATRARWSNCCRCQNNLDYIHQLFNGWMQGISAYAANMKKYDNLAVCG